jgi:hypothetical protein
MNTTGGIGMRRIRYRAAVVIGAAIGCLGLLLAVASPASAPGGTPWYPEANPPTSIDQCKDGGWPAYTDGIGYAFANQGACVSYVASQGRSDHH